MPGCPPASTVFESRAKCSPNWTRLDCHCEPTGRANGRPMTGSAKQSILAKTRLDCFVAEFIIGPAEGGTRWLLAMTAGLDKRKETKWQITSRKYGPRARPW